MDPTRLGKMDENNIKPFVALAYLDLCGEEQNYMLCFQSPRYFSFLHEDNPKRLKETIFEWGDSTHGMQKAEAIPLAKVVMRRRPARPPVRRKS